MRLLLALVALFAGMAPAAAQDEIMQVDSEVATVSVSTPDFAGVTGAVRWEHEFVSWPDSDILRIRFGDIVVPDGVELTVVLQDGTGAIVESFDAAQLAEASGLWSLVVSGDYARILLTASAPPVGLQLSVDAVLHSVWPGEQLSQIGAWDSLPARNYADDPVISKASRAVAKLHFVREPVGGPCTGFMIGSNLMMTNEHCIATAEQCRAVAVLFNYEETSAGSTNSRGPQLRCRRVVEKDWLLDYAVIELDDRNNQAPSGLRLTSAAISAGQSGFLVQHPGGKPKEVALKNCVIDDVSVIGRKANDKTDIAHTCDTSGGSSGSPLLSLDGRVVGLHHYAKKSPFPNHNRAIKMSRILKDLNDKGVVLP